MSTDLQNLGNRLVGQWTMEATHRAFPGAVITGSGSFEWLSGERFLIYRTHYDHPDFPDSVSIIGGQDGLRMHYFDSRGVIRLYDVAVTGDGWSITMQRSADAGAFASGDAPFSQRLMYAFVEADQSMSVLGQLAHDDVTWEDDIEVTYRRLT